jgi:hypothetical protein
MATRRKHRLTGWLAFLGLAFHLLLSFAHFHADHCRHEAGCRDLAHGTALSASHDCGIVTCPAQHESEDDCLVCRTTALLQFAPLPSSLTTQAPVESSPVTTAVADASAIIARGRRAFHARAPPIPAWHLV